MKRIMRAKFVPSYYARELLNKLQRFKQGSRTVREYYHELKSQLLRCGLEEPVEATENRFLSGLNHEIQYLLVHKEYKSLSQFLLNLTFNLTGKYKQMRERIIIFVNKNVLNFLIKPT